MRKALNRKIGFISVRAAGRLSLRSSTMLLLKSANTNSRFWFPLIAWMVVIFFFSTDTFSSAHTLGFIESILKSVFPSMSTAQLVFWHGVIRKVGHVTEYAILGFLAWRTFSVHSSVGLK